MAIAKMLSLFILPCLPACLQPGDGVRFIREAGRRLLAIGIGICQGKREEELGEQGGKILMLQTGLTKMDTNMPWLDELTGSRSGNWEKQFMSHFRSLPCAVCFVTASALAWLAAPVLDPAAGGAAGLAVQESKQDKQSVDEKTIRELIKQLGDDSFDKREEASKQLVDIGEAALDLLRLAAKDNPDAEVRQRAELAARAIGARTFVQVRSYSGHPEQGKPWVTRVVVTPDGTRVISVGSDFVRVWDLQTGKQIANFGERRGSYCFALSLSPDGKHLIAGCTGMQGHVFDLKANMRTQQLLGHTDAIWGAALLSDNKRAITGSFDKTIRVWDAASGKEIRAFKGVNDQVRCLTVSPDEKLVAAGHFADVNGPSTIRIWDLEKGVEMLAMPGHTLEVTSVSFSKDGKTLLSSSFDGTLRLWDVATGKELKQFTGHRGRVEQAAFTPDGKRIVSCGNQTNPTIRVWDIASGRQILESADVNAGFVSVAVLPDSQGCVSGGRDGVVRLWKWTK
jgi:hypothetical protein